MAEFNLSTASSSCGNDKPEDVSSGSEGYETPDEDFETKVKTAKAASATLPKQTSAGDSSGLSSDSDGSDSPDDDHAVTLSSKPFIRELKQLPVTKWYNLGLQLKVRQEELERIQLEYGDEKLCRTKMFGVWRREDFNPSYEKLLLALVAIGRRDLVESICKEKGIVADLITSSKLPSDYIPCHNSTAEDSAPKHTVTDTRLHVSDVPQLMIILSKHAYKWNELGIALGFTTPELRTIGSKPSSFHNAPISFFEDLLNEWVHWPNEEHNVLPTIEVLEDALKSPLIGLGTVSETLKSDLYQQKILLKQTESAHAISSVVPECVEKYAEFLKSKYQCALPLMPPGEWPPNRGRQHSDLTIVEKVSDILPDQESVKEKIKATRQGKVSKLSENERVIKSLDDVLDQGSNIPLKVLVEGVPGVGKSTLVRKSCKDWADGKSLQKFDLVLLLTLRNQDIRLAKSIEDLLEADDSDLKKELARCLEKTYGDGVLFILDGYDEVNEEEQQLFKKLIQGELLHKCSVVLTSRSYAVADLKYEEWIHHHVEILGFTEEQMENYFFQNISESDEFKPSTFVKSLKEETSLSFFSCTPLNCSILLYTFKQRKGKLPSTLTKLFEVFVISLIKRHSKKLIGKSTFKTLQTLPQPLKSQLSTLSKLAYGGIVQGKFLFSSEDIVEAFQVQESSIGNIEMCLLSLMVSTTSFGSVGVESHYQFVHATVQEFLAARWIAQQPEDKQKRFLQLNWKSARMRIMLVFYAGITNFQGLHFDDFLEKVSSDKYLDTILLHSVPSTQLHDQTSHLLGPGDSFTQPLRPREDLFVGVTTLVRDISLTQPFRPPMGELTQPVGHVDACDSITKLYSYKQVHQRFSVNPSIAVQAFLNIVSMLVETETNILQGSAIFTRRHVQSIQIGYYRLTTFDCSTLAKFLSYCPYPLDSLHFNFCNLTNQSVKIFHKISTNGSCCLKQCNELQFNYCGPRFSSALSLLPQIPWFQHTKVLCFHGLQYLENLQPEDFQLHVLLSMKNLTDLTVFIEQILENYLQDYEKVFLKFVKTLEKNNTLRNFSYYQSPSAATCESFTQLMSALSHNTRVSLEIGHIKIITDDSVTITDNICFKICSSGLASTMKFADARGIKKLNVQRHNLVLVLCDSCQASLLKSENNCDQTAELNHSGVVADQLLKLFHSTSTTAGLSQKECTDIKYCTPSLSSMLFLIPQIPWFQQTKVLCLHGLQYPKGLCPNFFQLHLLLTMENLIHLKVTVEGIPLNHLADYEAVFLKFVHFLQKNTTLESLWYYQTPSTATCTSFAQLMTALSHNTRVKLGIGLTQVVSVDSVTIPSDICFKVCSHGLASVMELADKRGIENLHFHQYKLFFLHEDCLTSELALSTCVINTLPYTDPDKHNPAMPFAAFLSKNQTLKLLDISRIQVNDEVAQYIAAGLAENKTLKEIKLNSTSTGVNHILQSLDRNIKLSIVYESNGYEVSYSSHCLTLKSVSSFILETTLDVNILDGYFKDTIVKEVVMETVQISEIIAMFLERLLTDGHNQTLKRLHFNRCRLDDVATAHIASGLAKNRSLKILNLTCHLHCHKSMGALKILKSLEGNTSLKELSLSWNISHPIIESEDEILGYAVEKLLTINQSLKRLNLTCCALSDVDAVYIAVGITKNHSLRLLNLSSNYITSAGAVELLKSLKNNVSLEMLDLSRNLLQSSSAFANGDDDESIGAAFEELLTYNHTLRRLELRFCCLDGMTTHRIAAGLVKSNSLKILNLSGNDTGPKIFKSLETNTSLEELDLSWNHYYDNYIGYSPMIGMAVETLLVSNQVLRKLDLSSCWLKNSDFVHFATGLARNQSLKILCLNCSYNVTSSGVIEILKSLETNTSLDELSISGIIVESASEALGLAVERMLTFNQTIRKLDLIGCGLNRTEATTHIAVGLTKNLSLKVFNLS